MYYFGKTLGDAAFVLGGATFTITGAGATIITSPTGLGAVAVGGATVAAGGATVTAANNFSDDASRIFSSTGTNTDGTGNAGTLTGSLDGLTAAEKTVINDLTTAGKNVEIIPKTTLSKTPDFLVDGVKTELKTLQNPNTNTGMKRIQEGFEQGAEKVIIDARQSGLTPSQAREIIDRAAGKFADKKIPGKVEIWTSEGTIAYAP